MGIPLILFGITGGKLLAQDRKLDEYRQGYFLDFMMLGVALNIC